RIKSSTLSAHVRPAITSKSTSAETLPKRARIIRRASEYQLAITLCKLDVMVGRALDPRQLLLAQRALDTCRVTQGKVPRRNLRSGRHQRSRAQDAKLADFDLVKDGRAHPDDAAIVHGAAVQCHRMPHGDTTSNPRGMLALGHMKDAVVLYG